MRINPRLPAPLLLGLLASCGGPGDSGRLPTALPPAAIQGGLPTGAGQFQSVGALLYDFDQNGTWDGDDQLCTGSLISPTVVLTAAHCVRWLPAGATLAVSFDDDLYAASIQTIIATSWAWNSSYGHDKARLNDIAVVLLPAGSTAGLTPLQLPTEGYLDEAAAGGGLRGVDFLNVGYGVAATQTGYPGFSYDGKRSVSVSPFMALQPTWLGLLMNRNATGEGGDCYGDSGGPKFLASNPTMVLALVVTGDVYCRATTWDWRVDTPGARAFLQAYVTLP